MFIPVQLNISNVILHDKWKHFKWETHSIKVRFFLKRCKHYKALPAPYWIRRHDMSHDINSKYLCALLLWRKTGTPLTAAVNHKTHPRGWLIVAKWAGRRSGSRYLMHNTFSTLYIQYMYRDNCTVYTLCVYHWKLYIQIPYILNEVIYIFCIHRNEILIQHGYTATPGSK